MEKLLLSMRQIASGPDTPKSADVSPEEQAMQLCDKQNSVIDYFSDGSSQLDLVKHDFKKGQRALRKDSKKLRAELVATKQMLSQALECRACKSPNKTA